MILKSSIHLRWKTHNLGGWWILVQDPSRMRPQGEIFLVFQGILRSEMGIRWKPTKKTVKLLNPKVFLDIFLEICWSLSLKL